MSIYAVGDIHGMADKLGPALEYIRADRAEGDRAVFLGDYIDRGPDSRDVIAMLLEFREEFPDTVFVRGNHEELFLKAVADIYSREARVWLSNGSTKTLQSYGLNMPGLKRFPADHLELIESTKLSFACGRFAFVHAGFRPPHQAWPLGESRGLDPRLWIREPFLGSTAEFPYIVVFGHTPQVSGEPLRMPNKMGIDTAAAFGGKLTVLKVDPGFEGAFCDYSVEYEQF